MRPEIMFSINQDHYPDSQKAFPNQQLFLIQNVSRIKMFAAINSKSARLDSQKSISVQENDYRSEMDHFGLFGLFWDQFG